MAFEPPNPIGINVDDEQLVVWNANDGTRMHSPPRGDRRLARRRVAEAVLCQRAFFAVTNVDRENGIPVFNGEFQRTLECHHDAILHSTTRGRATELPMSTAGDFGLTQTVDGTIAASLVSAPPRSTSKCGDKLTL
jgi:hypothetical protein